MMTPVESAALDLVAMLDEKTPEHREALRVLNALINGEEPGKHDWYHDGVVASVSGRLCRTCRFREDVVGDQPCTGSSALHTAAHEAGYRAGWAAAKSDTRQRLGL